MSAAADHKPAHGGYPGREFRVVTVPVLDTGIGRSLGYASDKEFMEATRPELDVLTPRQRRMLADVEERFARSVLGLPE